MTVSQRLLGQRLEALAIAGLLALGGLSCRPEDDLSGPGPEPSQPAQASVVDLATDRPIERRIVADEVHQYALDLEAGDLLHLVVDQRGVDVVTTMFGPEGKTIGEIDRRIGRYGPEPLIALAARSGRHRLEVRAFSSEKQGGRYELRVVDRRPASRVDRIRARAASAFARGEDYRRQSDHGLAEDAYRASLDGWREVGDEFWEAETLDRLGASRMEQRQWQRALHHHLESARLFAGMGDSRSEALARGESAKARFALGQIQEARLDFERALELHPGEDRGDRAEVLINLAQTYQRLGRTAEAFDRYDEARRLLEAGVDSNAKAQILHQMGLAYRILGESQRSLDYLNEAVAMRTRLDNQNGLAASIHQRGRLLLQLGKPEQAFEDYEKALELRRSTGHGRGQVAALTSLGELARRQGDRVAALARFQEALKIARSEGLRAPQAEARILWNLGASSDPSAAVAHYEASHELYRRVEDSAGEAEALLGLATARKSRGELEAAEVAVEAAIERVESLRPSLVSDDLSQSFSATLQGYFEFYIELLMDLESRTPGAGYAEKALAAAERGRARALLEMLTASGAEIRAGANPGLIQRERELQRQVNVAERWRLGLLEDRNTTEQERAVAARTVRRHLDELGRLRAEIRRESPHYAALTQPETLNLEEIQRLVLDRDTLLLEYWLGEARSFFFLASASGLSSFELPGRAALEPKALRAARLLSRSHRPESRRAAQDALCELSRILLGPVAGHLEDKRLLIVADGALQYLPFSALADPRDLGACPSAEPLLLANETTYLSSASVLAVLRRESKELGEPHSAIAVVADPVFSRRDPRLARTSAAESDPASAAPGGEAFETRGAPGPARSVDVPGGFERLRYSRIEAETILALAGAGFQALDFEARKQLILSGDLAGYRVVHLATHAFLDSSRPGLSGIVFSLVDENGREQDGLLRVHEIYSVSLPAELVVLSACRTALGKEIRGEGLIGLGRAFAFAGAQRLIVGLWNVEDRSTAALMGMFYRDLLVRELSPSAALRAAQISLRAQNPAPYYWAGFVHQGEYLPPRGNDH